MSRELFELLWGSRDEPLYGVHPEVDDPGAPGGRRPSRVKPVEKEVAFGRLAAGREYFQVVPLVAVGNRKEHCTRSFDVAWCDVDREPGCDIPALLIEVTEHLSQVGLYPSAVTFSGNRGLHVYLKLSADLPIERIEAVNRYLGILLDGEGHDRTRLLRAPGTVNAKSGLHCEVIDFSGVINDVAVIEALVPFEAVSRVERDVTSAVSYDDDEWLAAAEVVGGWGELEQIDLTGLMMIMRDYAAGGALWKSRYKSRSEVEQSIVYRLVKAGASDSQIKMYADDYLRKHWEEHARAGDGYIDRTIRAARRKHYDSGWLTSPLGGWPKKRVARYRHITDEQRYRMWELAQGEPRARYVKRVMAELGCSRATAHRRLQRLERDGFLVIEHGRVTKSPVTIEE